MDNNQQQTLLDLNEEKRSKCLVFTRVMGYHRPIESFNTGKKGEHKERIPYVEKKWCE